MARRRTRKQSRLPLAALFGRRKASWITLIAGIFIVIYTLLSQNPTKLNQDHPPLDRTAGIGAGAGGRAGPDVSPAAADQSSGQSNSQINRKKIVAENEGDRKIIAGKVVKVADGDTITVLDAEKKQNKIRLLGIDAPEKAQPFGSKCREQLAELVAGRDVRVAVAEKDRYGRHIGKILVDGRDANLAQVESGCAWHYKQYTRNQTLAERDAYAAAEVAARAAKKGLWQDAQPREPWAFRKEVRDARKPARERKRASGE